MSEFSWSLSPRVQNLRSLIVAAAAVTLGVPAFASHPVEGPTLYRVRPGSVVLACGGFGGQCEVRHLRGTIEVSPGYNGHFPGDSSPPAILHSELELVTAGGHASPFPTLGDLALTALEGTSDGGGFRFESPPESLQVAELVLTPFRDGPSARGGFMLDGFYDEGCCDRFRIDFGGVVLRPDHELDSLDLQGGRFHAVASWRSAAGGQGTGKPITLDDASGYFWFFQPDNPEVFVKILDACALNGRFWIFAGGLTNLGVDISIFDDLVDFAIPVTNPVGQRFATFIDTAGFPCNAPLSGG